jgi:chemotaxis protein MotB
MKDIMVTIGPTLKKLADDGHEIIVEGHTDNVPIHTSRFSSNWDLSTARATSVVQDMINSQHFPAKEMGAIGYGENRPLVANDTDEHRATNRRVVFFVKNKPAKYDNGQGKKPAEGEGGQTAAVVSDSNAPPVEEAAPAVPTEPTTETALPLPAEAPAEQTQQ